MALSALNRRRWALSALNRRAFWSLWLLLLLYGLSLFAELIANDRPVLVHYDGGYYMPVFKFYPETAFGGDLRTEADYTTSEVQCLIVAAGSQDCWDDPDGIRAEVQDQGTAAGQAVSKGWMLWPPIPYHYRTINNVGTAPSAPDAQHLLGTDDTARDVLFGTRQWQRR